MLFVIRFQLLALKWECKYFPMHKLLSVLNISLLFHICFFIFQVVLPSLNQGLLKTNMGLLIALMNIQL